MKFITKMKWNELIHEYNVGVKVEERERGRVSDSEKEMEDIDNSAQDFFWK